MRPAEYNTMRACEDRHWWYRVLHRLVLAEMRRRVPENARVLDAGCGTGGLMAQMPAWRVTGIDASRLALTHCAMRGLVDLVHGSINALPFADESFDAVLCLDVLYHADVNPETGMREMTRVLRPGGLMIFNHAAFELLRGSHDEAVCGKRRYRVCHVRASMEAHSICIDMMHYWNAWLFLPLLVRRRFCVGAGGDVIMPRPWLNRLLEVVGIGDAMMCRWLRLPFGSSLFAVGHKPLNSAPNRHG